MGQNHLFGAHARGQGKDAVYGFLYKTNGFLYAVLLVLFISILFYTFELQVVELVGPKSRISGHAYKWYRNHIWKGFIIYKEMLGNLLGKAW